ncbi:hypothetical protein GPALN_004616 [Globodera pallida]|nr:hypothetical protein GPALN_004616 [Globodera pallida]
MRLILFILQILAVLPITLGWVSENRRIEEEILRNYDRRHRPVKQESTVTQVQMFLTVNHIEKVDQLEGTMLLHGILWLTWYDDYLQWTPSEHNNTYLISLETWKIWQPTFALYNSARSNSWFVYMNGVPATVSNDGKIVAAGTFTFQVTCQFDFSDFPYDVQECPIVLADWIYDYSKVNLSGMTSRSVGGIMAKPAVRLSFDPLSENVKKHVAGWEIIDTWQRQCLWGPNGYCIDQSPIGPLDNYWSLIEFGVKIKRHAPYYGLTLVTPMCITIILTLLFFWLENLPLTILLYAINLLLEAFSGWILTQQIPPGDGIIPRIGVIHIWSVSLTLIALTFHCIVQLLLEILPKEFKFIPEQLSNFTAILNRYKLFQTECLPLDSFDPQTLMGYPPLGENHVGQDGGRAAHAGGEVLFEFDQSPPMHPIQQNADDSTIIQMDTIERGTEHGVDVGTSSTTTTKFLSIQLDVADPSLTQSTSASHEGHGSVPSITKKALSFNLPLFSGSAKKESPKVIKSPFSTGSELFGSKVELASNEQLERTDSNAQLIFNEEKVKNDGERQPNDRIINAEQASDKNGSKSVDKLRTKQRCTPLEQEFGFLRRLMFTLYCFISIILLAYLLL